MIWRKRIWIENLEYVKYVAKNRHYLEHTSITTYLVNVVVV